MIARCPHCRSRVSLSPHPIVRVAVAGVAWAVILAMAFGVALLGPVGIAVLPLTVFSSIVLASAAHEFTHGDRTCDACGRVYEIDGHLVAPERVTEPIWPGLSTGVRA